MLICTCCNRSYDAVCMVKCSICKKLFKNTCVDITANEVRVLNANKGYDWSCLRCREFGNEIKDLKALILKLQDDIQTLKAVNNESKTEPSSTFFEEIIEEINERNKRQRNVVIFGVTEPNQNLSNEARENSDKAEVSDILHTVLPELNTNNIKPIRLGRFITEKIRPIKIRLDNEVDVIKVIRHSNTLKNSRFNNKVFISVDRTPRQLEYFKKIKDELNRRKNAGENNIKIKYVNGIPKIISLN